MCLTGVSLLLTAAGAAGCGGSSSAAPPAAATPASSTQMFAGAVPVGGSAVVPFTVAVAGEVDITLTSAGPPSNIVMGLLIGTPATTGSATCLGLSGGSVTTAAGGVPQLLGNAPAGAYCVQVFDIGNQTVPITYGLTITHT
jgi:hypothetical protein